MGPGIVLVSKQACNGVKSSLMTEPNIVRIVQNSTSSSEVCGVCNRNTTQVLPSYTAMPDQREEPEEETLQEGVLCYRPIRAVVDTHVHMLYITAHTVDTHITDSFRPRKRPLQRTGR
jgi:hypothetical protein